MHPILAIRAFFMALFGRLPKTVLENQLPEPKPQITPEPSPAEESPEKDDRGAERGAVRTLAILQAEGRFLDFVFEDISSYEDADIGAAVREVHRGCKKTLEDHFDLGPVREEAEEAKVTVSKGYHPATIRLVGQVVGEPPFTGTLKHRGWKVQEVRLPKIAPDQAAFVAAPAEIEL